MPAGTDGAPGLVTPSVRHHRSFLAALSEYHAEGRNLELPAGRLADEQEFARYVEALIAGAGDPERTARYIASLRRQQPDHYLGGYVPQTTLWWAAGDEYLGRIAIRHRLTTHLLHEGGNIGYEIRPSARRRGHASAMLAAALPVAAALGIDPARIDCTVSNHASRRVIEENGGVLDEARDGSLFYWVPTR